MLPKIFFQDYRNDATSICEFYICGQKNYLRIKISAVMSAKILARKFIDLREISSVLLPGQLFSIWNN